MTAVSKDVYMNKSNDIVDEYNSTNHRTTKIKPFDVKDNAIRRVLTIAKKLTLKILNLRNSKCKNTFAKGYTPNWSEEVFVIKKFKIQFNGHMLLMISMVKKLLEQFMKENYKKLG